MCLGNRRGRSLPTYAPPLIAVAVAIVVWALAVAVLYALGRRTQARELATLIPNLPLLFKGSLRDPRVSRGSKAWLWFAVVWLVSPIDLIPECSAGTGGAIQPRWI